MTNFKRAAAAALAVVLLAAPVTGAQTAPARDTPRFVGTWRLISNTQTGIMIYDESGAREMPTPKWDGALKVELEDFYESLTEDKPMPHDGRWGMATVETCLAILQSTRERRETPTRANRCR